MIIYHRSSLLESQAQTVVNTVNTVGVMGKGIAHAFKLKFPDMFRQYKSLCDDGLIDIGKLWLWKGSDQWVLNFPTKKHWRYPSKLEYIDLGLKKFVDNYERQGIREIAFPRLGCGNGGLDWREVEPLMRRHLAKLPIKIYIHDHVVPITPPEHNDYSFTEIPSSFHDFICDIKNVVRYKFSNFKTISNATDFAVEINDEENAITIRANKKRIEVSEFDLFDLWTVLQKGPVSRSKMTGMAREGAYYVLAILSQLSYLKIVQISKDPDDGAIAVEMDRSFQRLNEARC